jgi:hypothetical protein
MRINGVSKLVLLSLMLLGYCSSAYAQDVNHYRSWCGPEGADTARMREALQLWFSEISDAIANQKNYALVAAELANKLDKGTWLFCWVTLDSKGAITDAKLNSKTGSDVLDSKIVELIQNLSPLKKPETFDYPQRLQIKFCNSDGSIAVSTTLNTRVLGKRIGE